MAFSWKRRSQPTKSGAGLFELILSGLLGNWILANLMNWNKDSQKLDSKDNQCPPDSLTVCINSLISERNRGDLKQLAETIWIWNLTQVFQRNVCNLRISKYWSEHEVWKWSGINQDSQSKNIMFHSCPRNCILEHYSWNCLRMQDESNVVESWE